VSTDIREGVVLDGKYRVERILGRGGMGVVALATHLGIGHKVAIKLLVEGASDEVVARFLREARASVRLKSEHVARVLDVGELADGAPFMVMEYLEGSDLSIVLRESGALPIAEAVQHVLDACEAIAEAHGAGIVHRDLKPANLLLTRSADGSSCVKVLDFGISKTTGPESGEGGDGMSLTQTATVLGSPLYMSPEQMKSARDVDGRADLWSLGAILYQLLTNRVPFVAEAFTELILMVNMEEPPPPSTFRADIPRGLEEAVLRCLEKRPERRFQNAAELALAIAPYGAARSTASAERAVRTLEKSGITLTQRSPAPAHSLSAPTPMPTSLTAHAAVGGASTPPPPIAAEPTMGAITALSSSGPSAAASRARSKLVPIGVGVAVLLGLVAVVLALRPRADDPTRVALAESAPAPPPSAAPALPGAASAAAPALSVVPAEAKVEAPPTPSASASAPPVRVPVVNRPPPPPPPPPPPTGKRNPLDIQIK
jgi:serine/threonine-protein kinase